MKQYVALRIAFYTMRDRDKLAKINDETTHLQNTMWSSVQGVGTTQPTPVTALAVAGMNDVLNSQGYTQAAWWNRIPTAAWALMVAIAVCCNFLIGYGAHRTEWMLFVVLPLAVAISFFLIAYIDSPRGGVIHVVPQNLASLAQSLSTQ